MLIWVWVEAGLLGPLPESQAVRLTRAITNNNKWLTVFIRLSSLIIKYKIALVLIDFVQPFLGGAILALLKSLVLDLNQVESK